MIYYYPMFLVIVTIITLWTWALSVVNHPQKLFSSYSDKCKSNPTDKVFTQHYSSFGIIPQPIQRFLQLYSQLRRRIHHIRLANHCFVYSLHVTWIPLDHAFATEVMIRRRLVLQSKIPVQLVSWLHPHLHILFLSVWLEIDLPCSLRRLKEPEYGTVLWRGIDIEGKVVRRQLALTRLTFNTILFRWSCTHCIDVIKNLPGWINSSYMTPCRTSISLHFWTDSAPTI